MLRPVTHLTFLCYHYLQVHPDWYKDKMMLNGWSWAEEPMPRAHVKAAISYLETKLTDTLRKYFWV